MFIYILAFSQKNLRQLWYLSMSNLFTTYVSAKSYPSYINMGRPWAGELGLSLKERRPKSCFYYKISSTDRNMKKISVYMFLTIVN